jgi:hypothetical protein
MSAVLINGKAVDTDLLLGIQVKSPRPGQRLSRVRVRLPYSKQISTIRVDANQLEAAMRPHSARTQLLEQLAQRVANLNPAAGEIGAGMLASLVEDAQRAIGQQGGAA